MPRGDAGRLKAGSASRPAVCVGRALRRSSGHRVPPRHITENGRNASTIIDILGGEGMSPPKRSEADLAVVGGLAPSGGNRSRRVFGGDMPSPPSQKKGYESMLLIVIGSKGLG